ncbi:MAG: hypothetical protein JWP57_274 [Spirosoma sp.]|nr:hypothetical protein [Spirosoma sp.]
MNKLVKGPLGAHVQDMGDRLIVDFSVIRAETTQRVGYVDKPADVPWLIETVSQEEFSQRQADEQRL